MDDATQKTALIIGAGPAGLTAALELLRRSDIKPIVFEATDGVGGISRTFQHNGNRIDLGGHRFFSKSDRVMDWWQDILPIHAEPDARDSKDGSVTVSYQNKSRAVDARAAEDSENVMLVRKRVSRIFFRRKFFDYPLSLNAGTIMRLGIFTTAFAGFSYIKARILPRRPEKTLEDFVINRFGAYLYGAFFRDYTEKVWGVPCDQIPADWGAQRIKGLSITAVIKHAMKKAFGAFDSSHRQKDTETSLIERFLYPKYGPGHMWERVTDQIRAKGGEVHLNCPVTGLKHDGERLTELTVKTADGSKQTYSGTWVFSTMPVAELVAWMTPDAPREIADVATQLPYRDFMTVGLLVKRLALDGGIAPSQLAEKLPDNWIYIQEPDVKVGRLQIFNNWSPYLVKDPDTIWVGMEYFLNESDPMWREADKDLIDFGIEEMVSMGILDRDAVMDGVIIRQKKAYPAYFGTYDRFHEVRNWLMQFGNLVPLGRNGQHRYNNQDHSMLTAMTAVDAIIAGRSLAPIWEVNAENEYHEEK